VKDGTYKVKIDSDGTPSLGSPIVMSDGYWVADDSGISIHGEMDTRSVQDALKLMDVKNGEIIGIWQNKELSFIDRSYHFKTKNAAFEVGEAFKQIAIWDCANSKALDIRYS
jgi:hypothetical protein